MVDPRPMTVYHRLIFPDSTHYVSVDPSVISARASVIRDLGAMRASALPKRPNCTPLLILPRDRVTSGCPSQNEVVWVVAPRAEVGKDDALEDEAGEDEWTLRMFAFFYGTKSSSAGTFDAIVIRNENGWVLDRLIRRVIWE